MNSVKLQDTKLIHRNLLNLLTVNYQKEKLKKKRNQENNPIYNFIKKDKIPRNKSNQGRKRSGLTKL